MEKSRHSRTIIATIVVLFSLLCWHDANSEYSIVWAAPSQKAAGGEGWYKTKWGMTPEEVSTALSNKIVPMPQQDRGKYKPEFQYTIPDFKIGNFSFSVYLFFKSGKGLNDVMVTKEGQGDHVACFLELEDALKKKYGNTSSVEDNTERYSQNVYTQSRYREWLTQSSFIKLTIITSWIGSNQSDMTNVRYSARNSGGDKL